MQTAATVFALATTATHWTPTNLGPTTTVNHDGYTWTVTLPASGEGVARITARDGYGGTEHLDIPATLGQTIGIVEAAMPALRAPTTPTADEPETAPEWDVEYFGTIVATRPTVQAARAHAEGLILAATPNPQDVTIRWECNACDDDTCPACTHSQPGTQTAVRRIPGIGAFPTDYSIQPAA